MRLYQVGAVGRREADQAPRKRTRTVARLKLFTHLTKLWGYSTMNSGSRNTRGGVTAMMTLRPRAAMKTDGFLTVMNSDPNATDSDGVLLRHKDPRPICVTTIRGTMNAKDAYDLLADSYDETFRAPRPRYEDDQIVTWLRRDGYLEGNVADLGCGTGLLLDLSRKDHCHYVGIDVSERMIQRAQAKHPLHRFYVDDMTHMKRLSANCYDAAISLYGSFSYCLEPEKATMNIRRILRHNGRFFVMLYGPRYSVRETYIAKKLDVTRILWTKRDAQKLFERAGFVDVEVVGWRLIADKIADKLSPRLLKAVHHAERAMSRIAPNWHYFLVATGRKWGD